MPTTDSPEEIQHQVFSSQAQCSARTGVPTVVLREAKKAGAPGFRGSCVWWHELKPYLDSHKELIEKRTEDNYNALKIKEKKLDIDLKEIEKKSLLGEYLDPKEVTEFLLRLKLSFESVVKGWSTELPPKLLGKNQSELEYQINQEVSNLLSGFGLQMKEKMEAFKHAKRD